MITTLGVSPAQADWHRRKPRGCGSDESVSLHVVLTGSGRMNKEITGDSGYASHCDGDHGAVAQSTRAGTDRRNPNSAEIPRMNGWCSFGTLACQLVRQVRNDVFSDAGPRLRYLKACHAVGFFSKRGRSLTAIYVFNSRFVAVFSSSALLAV